MGTDFARWSFYGTIVVSLIERKVKNHFLHLVSFIMIWHNKYKHESVIMFGRMF